MNLCTFFQAAGSGAISRLVIEPQRIIRSVGIFIAGQSQVLFHHRGDFPFVTRIENVNDRIDETFNEARNQLWRRREALAAAANADGL